MIRLNLSPLNDCKGLSSNPPRNRKTLKIDISERISRATKPRRVYWIQPGGIKFIPSDANTCPQPCVVVRGQTAISILSIARHLRAMRFLRKIIFIKRMLGANKRFPETGGFGHSDFWGIEALLGGYQVEHNTQFYIGFLTAYPARLVTGVHSSDEVKTHSMLLKPQKCDYHRLRQS